MKMDSLGKTSSSATSSTRSSATGGRGRPSYLDSAAYSDTFKVEFQNSTREMAVDVPDSFIAQIKTPPKYPPPPSMQQRSSTLPVSSSLNLNGRAGSSSSSSPPPPMLSARDHLRIEQDGHLLNTLPGPKLPPGNKWVQPNKEQSLRIQKYSNDLTKESLEADRKQRENQLLRQSIRTSQKMSRLKEQHQQPQHHPHGDGVENRGFEPEQEQLQHAQFKDPGQILNVINNVETLCANVSNSNHSDPETARSTSAVSPMLKSLVHCQDFQKALKVYSTVSEEQ